MYSMTAEQHHIASLINVSDVDDVRTDTMSPER
jgi:hypothetical protein